MNKIIGIAVGSIMLVAPFAAFANSNVTASADGGSTISPSGLVIIPTGVTQTFGISANSGYNISDVSLDGVSQGAVGSLDFTGIAADGVDHTIDVSSQAIQAAASSGDMPYCSGPTAPGWQNGTVGGGCGGTGVVIHPGAPGCPIWFTSDCLER